MKRFAKTLVLLLCIALATATWGAPQRGQRGQIIRAEYGYGNRWTDVTERVASLTRGDVLRFRVDDATLGVTSRPGAESTLRIQVRDRDGQTHRLVFRENELVDLRGYAFDVAVSGGLRITRATYGTSVRSNDVTNRLNSQIRDGQLSMAVNNSTMGGDPDHDRPKTLTVSFTYNGRADRVSVAESGYLNLPSDASQTGYNLQIIRAIYGTSIRSNDVTDRLNSQIRDGQLSMQVNNTTMGGDPDHDRPKTLTVDYTLNGRADQLSVAEGGYLNLPSGTSQTGYDLQITRASYGTSVRSNDVTNRLNSQIRDGQLSMAVNNTTMGGDPDHDRPKTLTVSYTLNGRADQISVAEGGYLNLPGGTSQTGYDLQINRATYGTYARSNDVTNRLNSQIRDGQLSLQVNNTTMGGDPDHDRPKTLTVSFTNNGRADQVSVAEGDYLRLPTGYGTSVAQTVRCESVNYRRIYCSADTRGGVRLTRQLGGTNCVRGDSWDYDQSGIWVDNGCRADFEVLSNAGSGAPVTQTIRCESQDYRRQYCAANTSGGVRLLRKLGDADCVRGTSWDVDRDGIWVDNGCRAEFEMTSQGGAYSGWSQRVITSGSQLSIRTNEAIDSKTAREGQRYSAVMEEDVRDNTGTLAIPKGADVELVIRSAEGSDLVLDIDSIMLSGQRYYVQTADMKREGGGGGKRTAGMAVGGAAIGAIIGAIVGGGKGAAIGAVIGGAGGVGVGVLTKGKEVRVPSETVLNFKLEQDLYLSPQP